VDGAPEYANHGHRNEASTFARLGVDAGRWHHFGDAQVRWTRFGYEGDQPIGSVSWVFVNPKLGTRYDLAAGFSAYASVGHASREPARSDLFAGEDNPSVVYDLEAVSPERVVNVEAGLEYRRPGLAAQVNLYDMEFRDEIALTGELSEVGLPLRQNVDRSYRRGVELDVTWQPSAVLRIFHTAHAGRARIREWTQFYDVYDASGTWTGATSRVHRDVPPLGSPAYVGNLGVDYAATAWLSAAAAGRYVSKIYLDNTRTEPLTAPGHFNLDATVSLSLRRLVAAGDPRLRVQVNNVLDNQRMFASGYSYQYFVHDGPGELSPFGVPYYYPLATRSLLVTLDLRM
jgi:iron complex outermembrane receptor protein